MPKDFLFSTVNKEDLLLLEKQIFSPSMINLTDQIVMGNERLIKETFADSFTPILMKIQDTLTKEGEKLDGGASKFIVSSLYLLLLSFPGTKEVVKYRGTKNYVTDEEYMKDGYSVHTFDGIRIVEPNDLEKEGLANGLIVERFVQIGEERIIMESFRIPMDMPPAALAVLQRFTVKLTLYRIKNNLKG